MTVKILKFRPNIRCDKIFFQSCIMNHGYNTCRHPPIRPADSGLTRLGPEESRQAISARPTPRLGKQNHYCTYEERRADSALRVPLSAAEKFRV